MIVRCIANTARDIPDNYLGDSWRFTRETVFEYLTIGKEYVVYAVETENKGQVRYAIANDVYTSYPVRYVAPLFEVVDSRVSKYWRFAFNPPGVTCGILAFEEWSSDPDEFYWNLVEGEEPELTLFRRMKTLMDEEAQE